MPLHTKLTAALIGSGWDEETVEDLLSDQESETSDAGGVASASVRAETFAQEHLGRVDTEGRRPLIPRSPSPETFEFLEVYAGCSHLSKTMVKLGLRVLPPIELRDGWDLQDRSLFWGIMGLVRSGRVRFIWLAPPCTTFSLARNPKLRSTTQPWGLNLLENDTLTAIFMLARRCFWP